MAEMISMPKLGFDMQEGTLVRWLRAEGEDINKGDVLAEIETDKATVEVESSAGGVVRRLLVEQGAVVPIGAPIAIVGSKDEKIEVPAAAKLSERSEAAAPVESDTASPSEPAAAEPPQVEATEIDRVKASPLARKLASEARVDVSRVRGSGPGGRVVRRDIEAAAAAGVAALSRPPAISHAVSSGLPVPRPDETLPLSKLRTAIGRRMTESKTHVPHFYVTHEYRVDSLLNLREQVNSYLAEEEKISVNDFVVKATALCLRAYPNLNAAYQGDRVLRHGAVNVGVAVAVEGGLLTVVCRDADQKPLRQISRELKALASRVRGGKVRAEDIEGSTFSVSNLGMFDVDSFAAIINPPEAAILAVGSARQVPVVESGTVRTGWTMKATIAVDHRVSDGAEAAQFMQSLAKYLEVPAGMLL